MGPNAGLVFLLAIPIFLWGYWGYARYLTHRFGEDDANPTPACTLTDQRDYVPARRAVLFSHHFASIAAAGPIVGPTLALVYGFWPGWFWIVLGSVLVGGVHDLSALFTSVRERGQSIAEVAERAIGRFSFFLFLSFAVLALLLVVAVFLQLTAAALQSLVPASDLGIGAGHAVLRTTETVVNGATVTQVRVGGVASTSVIVMTAAAPLLGYLLYRRGVRARPAVALAAVVAVVSLAAGLLWPVQLEARTWMVIISGYVLLATMAPVWVLLMPRDFINSLLLYVGVAALVGGALAAGARGVGIDAPATDLAAGAARLGAVWPILFITIACGACSGFHSLVASGTTSKQIAKESDVRRVGYGAMVLEGAMALGVLIAVAAGLSHARYTEVVFDQHNAVLGFALGLGGLLDGAFSLPRAWGTLFGILLVEGFLITTLDTAVRLMRYLLNEFWGIVCAGRPPALLRGPVVNSVVPVGLMLWLALTETVTTVWPIFGAANQLLAALTFVAVTAWLFQRGRAYWFTLWPGVFMFVMTLWSLVYLLQHKYLPAPTNWALVVIDVVLIALALGVLGQALWLVTGARRFGAPAPAGGQ